MIADDQFRALVVDDEPLVRVATSRALNQGGFLCELASDGSEGLKALRDKHFDLVVADLRMPEIHGHRLIVETLAMEPRPVVIVLTGVDEPKLVRDLLARGVDDVIFKPAHYDLLTLKANALVQRRHYAAQGEAPESNGSEAAVASDDACGRSEADDRLSANALLCESERVAAQIVEVRHGFEAPPETFDGFRSLSGNALCMDDLAAAIRRMPEVANDALLLANCALFRATQDAIESLGGTRASERQSWTSYVAGAVIFAMGLAVGFLGNFGPRL